MPKLGFFAHKRCNGSNEMLIKEWSLNPDTVVGRSLQQDPSASWHRFEGSGLGNTLQGTEDHSRLGLNHDVTWLPCFCMRYQLEASKGTF